MLISKFVFTCCGSHNCGICSLNWWSLPNIDDIKTLAVAVLVPEIWPFKGSKALLTGVKNQYFWML